MEVCVLLKRKECIKNRMSVDMSKCIFFIKYNNLLQSVKKLLVTDFFFQHLKYAHLFFSHVKVNIFIFRTVG